MPLIVVVQDFPCPICGCPTPHAYKDKSEELVCMWCHSKVKLVDPIVVIGKIQN